MTRIATLDGAKIEDLTSYPTRAEVAEALSCYVRKVRSLERAGKLRPIVDSEGTHRFHPWDVQQAMGGSPEPADLATPETNQRSNLGEVVTRAIGFLW